MRGYGWHWTPCEAANVGGGGPAPLVFVVALLFVGWLVVQVVEWVGETAAGIGRFFDGAGAVLGWVLVVAGALAVAALVLLVVRTNRRPAHVPAERPRRDETVQLRRVDSRSLTAPGKLALDDAARAELAELTAAVPMPERFGR